MNNECWHIEFQVQVSFLQKHISDAIGMTDNVIYGAEGTLIVERCACMHVQVQIQLKYNNDACLLSS